MLDVVIVSHNSGERLPAAIAPLGAAADIRIFVVDNASTDATQDMLGALPVVALLQTDNRGFAAGCNVGWRAGNAPYVLFLNPDAEISETALRRLVDALDTHPEAGAAAPRVLDALGELELSLRRLPRLRSTFAQALFLHRLFPRAAWADELLRDPALYEREWAPECVSGACLLVRRSVLEQLGGWDERFFLYREDVDL
ncbi:MAG: glycosyltransferase family 2 protein, partial [Gaiellaceae bacterium]